MNRGTILIIDDEESLRKLLARIVRLEGYEVYEAATLKSGLDHLTQKKIDILLCDVKLPDGDGVEFVKEARSKFPSTEVILLTAYGNIPDGVRAIKHGAFDYITKANDNDRILPLLAQAMEKVNSLKKKSITISQSGTTSFSSIIGRSARIQEAISLARKVSATNATVLLLGETGTGKEVFAKAIHGASNRNTGSFVAINCSAFTRELLEGELFGHKAGAFTGALKDKKGLFEVANDGTLFLDEIGEMHIELQAKLLRVLDNGEFIKLGDTRVTIVNTRIIAATNRNLQKEANEGLFREDLFYRLNTFTISLPPLRERKEDIKELTGFFLASFAKRENKDLKISAEALEALEQYTWKGNIRELRNVMERAVILADGESVMVNDLPSDIRHPDIPSNAFSLAQVEKNHIRKMLTYTGSNKTKTAQLLGIGLATLYRKMEEYGLPK